MKARATVGPKPVRPLRLPVLVLVGFLLLMLLA